MYEPFVKGDQSRNDSSNSGLGLAIVKKKFWMHMKQLFILSSHIRNIQRHL